MKVALYARVSTHRTEDPEERQRQDPENQLRRLRPFAEARGATETVTYIDYASGADPNRPHLAEMMEAARRREISDILIVKLDRIMRSTMHLHELAQDLEAWGVGLICLDQPIDTKSSTGRLTLNILAAIAEFERDLIRERTMDGLARAREEGRVGGRRPREVDMAKLDALRAEGLSVRSCAKIMGVPRSTLMSRVAGKRGASAHEGKEPRKGADRKRAFDDHPEEDSR